MARAVLALAASLAAAVAAAQPLVPSPPSAPPRADEKGVTAPAEPPPSAPAEKPPLPRGAVLEEVSGTVRELDRRTYTLVVDTASGDVTLSLDRNTMVYTAGGLATVLDVTPGTRIRAGRNADFLAYWVQVRSATAAQEPATTPGQGTGPAGGGSAPAGEAGGPGTAGAPGSRGEGGAAPGTSVPGAPPR